MFENVPNLHFSNLTLCPWEYLSCTLIQSRTKIKNIGIQRNGLEIWLISVSHKMWHYSLNESENVRFMDDGRRYWSNKKELSRYM